MGSRGDRSLQYVRNASMELNATPSTVRGGALQWVKVFSLFLMREARRSLA